MKVLCRVRVARYAVVAVLALVASEIGEARAQPRVGAPGELRAALDALAQVAGEPRLVSAAGLTRDDTPLLTIENSSPFNTTGAERRIVIVGGLDGNPDSARIVLDAVRWFKTAASEQDRTTWAVSGLPLADPGADGGMWSDTFPPVDGFFDHPEQPESRYVWRWVTYQVPDLVVEIRVDNTLSIRSAEAGAGRLNGLSDGSLAAAMASRRAGSGVGPVDTMLVTARPSDGAAVMRAVLARAPGRSPLHAAIADRVARDPMAVARLLAGRYPETPGISYIPALAWVHTLRLAALTEDLWLHDKVMAEVRPWLSGEQALFGDTIRLNAVAGTMVFAAVAKSAGDTRGTAARLAGDGVVLASAETSPGVPRYGAGWSDDIFLGTIAAAVAADTDGLAAATRLITHYAGRLQRPDGLFDHAADAPTAWGRGNGFAALGLAETLTVLPVNHPGRAAVLDIYRRHMVAMRANQAPDGMWRQVVDVTGSYRETSVTALTLTAMARGLRLGWLDDAYRPIVERAWRALLAHVLQDGTLVDVCISTGAGPTPRHYLDRPAVNGADDRGGAMVLGAALEMNELNQGPQGQRP